MTVSEYLSRYHIAKQKIEKLQGLVDTYIRLANEIPGMQFDQIRIDGGKNLKAPFEKWILKALDHENEIMEIKQQLPMIKADTLKEIEKLKDYELERVLILRYIDWCSWKEIAQEMVCSYSTARRRHNQAIENLKFHIRLSRSEQG